MTSSAVKNLSGLMRQVSDGWQQVLSGLGTARDKGRASAVRYCPSPILDERTLQEAYRGNWLVRRIVNDLPEEATRRGFGDGIDTPRFDELNFAKYPEGALQRACNLARLMGGAGVYLGYADGGADVSEPAREGAEVSFLEVFHRFDLQAEDYTRERDPASPEYGRPQLWKVTGQYRSGLVFHDSRMIRFPGQARADDWDSVSATDRDWDDSVLQSCWEDAIRYGLFWQQVSHLMSISSVGVLKIAGLIEMLAKHDTEDAELRIDLLNETLSITRMLMLDAKHDESYSREAVSFTDVPALLQELQLATAGAVGEPVTKLFGRSPAGMNATGESDMRQWYDKVDQWRETVLKPRAERLMSICEGTEVEIEWPPLWEPTEKECAETEAIKVGTMQQLWSMAVTSPAEIREALHEHKPIGEVLEGPPPDDAGPPQPDPELEAAFGATDDEDAVAAELGYESVDEDELDGLLADSLDGWREDAARKYGPVQYFRGPKGGIFYKVNGRKVYGKRVPKGAEHEAQPETPAAKAAKTPKASSKPAKVETPPAPKPEPVKAAKPAKPPTPPTQAKPSTPSEREAALLKAVQSDPQVQRGGLAQWAPIRQAAGLPKEDFDAAAIALAKRGDIVMHHHDAPFGPRMTDADRDAMVSQASDGPGSAAGRGRTYYAGVGIAKRPETPAPPKPSPAPPKPSPAPPKPSGAVTADEFIAKVTTHFDGTPAEREMFAQHMQRIGADRYVEATGGDKLRSVSFKDTLIDEPELASLGNLAANAAGYYNANEHRMAIGRAYSKLDPKAVRTSHKPLGVGKSATVTVAGLNDHEVTLTHEFGHAVHMAGSAKSSIGEQLRVNQVIKNDWTRAMMAGTSVSDYAKSNEWEHWAESYTAYMHRKDDLRALDLATYNMVEDVLRSRGVL